jgi:hypothetical protein
MNGDAAAMAETIKKPALLTDALERRSAAAIQSQRTIREPSAIRLEFSTLPLGSAAAFRLRFFASDRHPLIDTLRHESWPWSTTVRRQRINYRRSSERAAERYRYGYLPQTVECQKCARGKSCAIPTLPVFAKRTWPCAS